MIEGFGISSEYDDMDFDAVNDFCSCCDSKPAVVPG
jgi:hypothetical protein